MKLLIGEWGSFQFWISIFEIFKNLGPLAPILLAMLESFVPALPLVAIVTLNTTAHGVCMGFLYSWLGSTLGCILVFSCIRVLIKPHLATFIDHYPKIQNGLNWVSQIDHKILFYVVVFPFTPSSFLNLIFGLSDYSCLSFYRTMALAKIGVMLELTFFGSSLAAAFHNPRYLILAGLSLGVLVFISSYLSRKHGLK